MPFTSEYVSEGTISWPEILESAKENLSYGRRSSVFPASSGFFSLYNPKEMVKFGWNPDIIDYTTSYISSVKGIKKHLLEDFRVIEFSPAKKRKRDSKRDFDAEVSSMYDEDVVYTVNLGNLSWRAQKYGMVTEEDILEEFFAFLIYEGSCTFGAVTKKGRYCSMPEDYFMEWHDAPIGEYDRILSQSSERKPYGNLICKHQSKALAESGLFPHIFNKMRFYHFFPDILRSLRLNYKKNLRIKDLNKILLPHIENISFGLIPDYLKSRTHIDKKIEELENGVVNSLRSLY